MVERKAWSYRRFEFGAPPNPPMGLCGCSVPKCRTTRLSLRSYCISISGRIYILASYLFCYLRRSPTACFPIGLIAI